MTKSLRGRGDAAPFFGSKPLHICAGKSPKRGVKVPQESRSGKRLRGDSSQILDGIVGGERVHVFVPAKKGAGESERAVELRIRAAVSAAGCLVWKHTVEPCWSCGKKPTKRTGLGEGASDLLAVCMKTGRAIFIEVKRPGYRPSDVRPMQRTFLATVRRLGAVSGIATNEAEALALVEEARRRS